MNTYLIRRQTALRALTVAGLVFAATTSSWAEGSKILQIEEHWELRVGEPDPDRSAPQATMVMSPYDDLSGDFFLFTVNHRSLPDFSPGGMQVQLWDGESPVTTADGGPNGAMNQTNDVVSWVQRMKVEDGTLSFEVVGGSSTSWGTFGNDGSLHISTPTSITSLNGYRPAISIGESQVGYAGNRVQSLTLSKLVWLTDDGETHELYAPIDIDADLDP